MLLFRFLRKSFTFILPSDFYHLNQSDSHFASGQEIRRCAEIVKFSTPP